MPIIRMPGGRTDEEKFEDAKRFLPILLVRFPYHGDFQLFDIITKFKEVDPVDRKAMIDCQNQLKRLLDDNYYVRTGTFSSQLQVTDIGRDEKKRLIEEAEDQKRKSQSSPNQFSFPEYMNSFIYSMLDVEEPFPYALLYYNVRDKYPHIPMNKVLIELKRLELISISHSRKGDEKYILHEPIKRQIRNLPTSFENKPYEFFLSEEERKHNESIEKHNLELQKLRDEVLDYQDKLRREKNHYRIALAAAIIEGLGLILSLLIK